MEVILKPIRAEKAEKRRKLMELERLVKLGGNEDEIEKLRKEVGKNGSEEVVKPISKPVVQKVREVKKIKIVERVELSLSEYIRMLALGLSDVQIQFVKDISYYSLDKCKEEWGHTTLEYRKMAIDLREQTEVENNSKKRSWGSGPWQEWGELAESNDIDYGGFMNRVRRGWSYEEAATKPMRKYNGGN